MAIARYAITFEVIAQKLKEIEPNSMSANILHALMSHLQHSEHFVKSLKRACSITTCSDKNGEVGMVIRFSGKYILTIPTEKRTSSRGWSRKPVGLPY